MAIRRPLFERLCGSLNAFFVRFCAQDLRARLHPRVLVGRKVARAVVAASRAQVADRSFGRQITASACLEGEIIDARHPPSELNLPAATDLTLPLAASHRGGLEAQLTEVPTLESHLTLTSL